MKTCTQCLIEKPESEFYLDRGKPRSKCKDCVKAARNLYYKTHREQSLASALRYSRTPNGKKNRRAWLAARAKTETFKEYSRQWAKTPKGQESRRRRVNKYAKTEKGFAANKRRHARRRAREKNIIATLTFDEWNNLLIEHDYKCAYCYKLFSKEFPATQDHVVPLSKGGQHTAENIVPSCRSCNSRKKDKLL